MTSKERSFRRPGVRGLSLTVVAFLTLAIVGVSGASAYKFNEAFTTPPRLWATGAQPGAKLVGTRAVTMSLTGPLTYRTTLAGSLIEWSASGIECANCKIENKATTSAVFSGEMTLTGVKSIQPAGCVMPSTLSLKSMTGLIGGRSGNLTEITDRLGPTSGTTWASYQLTGCAFAGQYSWTGSAFGEFDNALGVNGKTQRFEFSQAIQEDLGSRNSLKWGEEPVFFTGSVNINAEEEFQVKEEALAKEHNLFTTPSANPLVPRNWYTGAQPGTKLAGTQSVQPSLASEQLTFNTTVAGQGVIFKAAGLECPNCMIENRAGTGENKSNTEAVFSGEISLTGMKVVSPAGCSMPSTFRTKPMIGAVGGEKGSSTRATFRLGPAGGTTWGTIELLGEKCPVSGLYKLNGNEFGEFANALGVDAKNQRFRLNQTVQESLGTSTSLKFGENPVSVFGEANTASVAEFQVKEQ